MRSASRKSRTTTVWKLDEPDSLFTGPKISKDKNRSYANWIRREINQKLERYPDLVIGLNEFSSIAWYFESIVKFLLETDVDSNEIPLKLRTFPIELIARLMDCYQEFESITQEQRAAHILEALALTYKQLNEEQITYGELKLKVDDLYAAELKNRIDEFMPINPTRDEQKAFDKAKVNYASDSSALYVTKRKIKKLRGPDQTALNLLGRFLGRHPETLRKWRKKANNSIFAKALRNTDQNLRQLLLSFPFDLKTYEISGGSLKELAQNDLIQGPKKCDSRQHRLSLRVQIWPENGPKNWEKKIKEQIGCI